MSDDYIQKAKATFERIIYATIATADKNGQPWNSPVRYYSDDDLNIYWFSDKQNQHSQNIRANDKAFIVIYDSTAPEGDGEGLYIEVSACEIDDPEEIKLALSLKQESSTETPDDFAGNAIRRVYKAQPQRVWMNDAEMQDGVFVRDYRVELSLNDLKAALQK